MGFDLNLSSDQRQIVDALEALLDDAYPLSRLRETQSDDLTPLYDFGAFSLSTPEADGGSGLSAVDEALVHKRLGRHLVSSRALATVMAAALARQSGQSDLAMAISSLERSVSPAILNGGDALLFDPASAELALLFGKGELVLVEVANAETTSGLGHSVAVARMELGSQEKLVRTDNRSVLTLADLLVSAQLLGVAEGARDLAVSYAEIRHQFGKPIGAFQAVKHHCANMAIEAEMLSAQLDMAALALADGRADASFQVAALRRLAPRVALGNARICIQLHGGIGFSAEAHAHHFLKQAHLLSSLGMGEPILELVAPMAPHFTATERN